MKKAVTAIATTVVAAVVGVAESEFTAGYGVETNVFQLAATLSENFNPSNKSASGKSLIASATVTR